MRRPLTALLLAAIVAGVGWTLWQWARPHAVPDPWRAIPAHAAVIIEVPDPFTTWERATQTAQLWNSLRTLPAALAVDSLMNRALRALHHAPSSVLIAFVPSGGDDFGVLLAWPVAKDAEAMNRMAEALGVHREKVSELAQGGTITFRADTALPELSLAQYKGVAIITTGGGVMEEALLAMKSAPSEDSLLARLRSTSGEGSDAHVLIHSGRLANVLAAWMPSAAVDALPLTDGWAELDLRIKPEAVLLSGVFAPPDPTIDSATASPGIASLAPLRMLPPEVCAMRTEWISDGRSILAGRELTDDTLASTLLEWVTGTVVLAEAPGDSSQRRGWAVLPARDPQVALERLEQLCTNAGAMDTVQHRGVRMMHIRSEGLLEHTLGAPFSGIQRPWCCLLHDHAVFSDDPGDLRTAIDAWLDGNSLADDLATADFFQRYSSGSDRVLWCDLHRALPWLGARLKPATAAALGAHANIWNDLGSALLQFTDRPRGGCYITFALQHAPVGQPALNTLWTARLPAPIVRKPDVLRNHLSGARDVFVQDERHAVHLLGSTGLLLWSRQLDGPIMGAVHQVDRYRNGKLQLLFNTAGYVYMIDRTGRDVEGFPRALKEQATAPMAVFDYDGKREYRLLIPTAEGHVINLAIDGHRTVGWDPPVLPHTSTEPVRHLRIRGKDHLLVIDSEGGLHVWDRRGAVRHRTKTTLAALDHVLDVQLALDIDGTLIAWMDESGGVLTITLAGKGGTIASSLRSPEHLIMEVIKGHGTMVVAIKGDSLAAMADGRPLFSRSLEASISSAPILFDLGQQVVIGIRIASRNELHVLDLAGRDLDGSPYAGSTPFSIADLNLDGSLELIAGTRESSVVAYKFVEGE